MRSKDYWIISAGTFVRYGTHAALQTLWAGPLLMEALRFSPVQAGNILLAMNIGLIVGGPVWGAVSDRVFKTPKWVVAGGLLMLALITFGLRALPPGTSAFACRRHFSWPSGSPRPAACTSMPTSRLSFRRTWRVRP